MTLRLPEPQLSRHSLLFFQSALRFLSARPLVRKQIFCPSSISETHLHTLTFLCHNWRKKNTKQKAKDNFKTSEVDTKQNCYFLLQFHFLKSLFWEIILIFFISLPPFYFIFNLVSLSLTILPGCYPTGLSSFFLYKHITQKNTKKTGNAIIKLSLPPRHRFFRQQHPFQHSWKEKKCN